MTSKHVASLDSNAVLEDYATSPHGLKHLLSHRNLTGYDVRLSFEYKDENGKYSEPVVLLFDEKQDCPDVFSCVDADGDKIWFRYAYIINDYVHVTIADKVD